MASARGSYGASQSSYGRSGGFGGGFSSGGGFRDRESRPMGGSEYGKYSIENVHKEKSTERNSAYEKELFEDPHEVKCGINFDAYDEIPVEITGNNAPQPMNDWEDGGFSPKMRFNLRKCGFKKPTPVQKYSVPAVMNFRNLMACAQTGSGKTAAFLVPTFENLMRRQDRREEEFGKRTFYPRAVVLAPTRELAQQIHKEARKFLYTTGLRAVCIFGGGGKRDQISNMEDGMEILIGTPGRMNDLCQSNYINMSCVQFLILDEADRMLDMGFAPQIREIVGDYEMPTKENRTTLMFSATFPREIQRLARDFMDDYLFLAVGRVGAASELITQIVYPVEYREKDDRLVEEISSREGKILVFVQTKRKADELQWELDRTHGISADAIHGDKSQYERERALQNFRQGRSRVLIGTDVCARGIDIPKIETVIQYDLPQNIDDYVHRIGRSARAGNKGTAIAFVTRRDGLCGDLKFELEKANQDVPSWLRDYSRGSRSKGRKGSRFGGRDFRKDRDRRDFW